MQKLIKQWVYRSSLKPFGMKRHVKSAQIRPSGLVYNPKQQFKEPHTPLGHFIRLTIFSFKQKSCKKLKWCTAIK